MITSESIELKTQGNTDIIDLTVLVQQKLDDQPIKDGIVTLCMIGSTAALTTCEFEPGLVEDLKELFERLAPHGKDYHHDAAWGDGNGHAHLRASLVGPSLCIPFENKKLVLGTWQQIILIDFDNRTRQRKIFLQFLGE